ncbi:MAG: nitrite/sulfite reductase [Alphaproteobacteria bacterium]|nr:nitrite/sulfite reductase [Alphaproteobacteria bacterium]
MYQYDQFDHQMLADRNRQFRSQVERRLTGALTEEEFRPLRLMNGLYLQLHAYMLRVAVPYGLLSSAQLRQLAMIARKYDRGYGHFTTRQNLQYNWIRLEDMPDILDALAEVEMHAIQTSGNCIRNISTDEFAGVARDEIEDPRPYAEILRQWSTFHPEFSYLPRKFKIALTGATRDRAAVAFHDLAFRIVRNDSGEVGFQVIVGGGMGRTPVVGKVLKEWIPKRHLLAYSESVMRVYNGYGRRDNIYKARIKILVNDLGVEEFARQVDEDFARTITPELELEEAELERMRAFFAPPAYRELPERDAAVDALLEKDKRFRMWFERNVVAHKQPGYAIVVLSLKSPGVAPGDATDDQMEAVARLADEFSLGLLRTTFKQNLVLSDVELSRLPELWGRLKALSMASPTVGTLTDIICCPGLDYCSLANARSIPVAEKLIDRFDDLDFIHDLGDLRLNISGCINACGHHHAGNIGILGVDKKGEEFYQLTLGGSPEDDASIGKIMGPAFSQDEIVSAIEKVIEVFLARREPEERFVDCYRRLGMEPFKERVYADH